ncbi:sensor histidine kinase [Caenimonas sedimenti]|uniref:histidine kinase n=1 Tax=Caenimonas sedimenti TaxID=2596921 RepID=A0A562ZPX8_9BURK|nr:sensor histidine kinase [Caenimonas sedimenti]TWO70642.1 sensor histidine kinase [Caenimonas sedimenti]
MRWKRLSQLTLAQQLLLLLLPALLLLSLAELRWTALDVHRAADAAYDRSLLGALKAIDANVSTESGGLAMELPYRMFEFFELTASGAVHYRVATADGLVELGSADLPAPPRRLVPGVPQFYDGVYFGDPVRVVANSRELNRLAAGSPSRQLVIQVAESTRSRDDFRQVFVRRAAFNSTLFLVLAVSLCIGAVLFVLRPIGRLSREVLSRAPGELQPIPADGAAPDVRPLVDAINQHLRRTQERMAQQHAFLDDASHQLRTHLTTLRMQVEFAVRQQDAESVQQALAALMQELQRATRSTNQFLSLTRSEAVQLQPEWFRVHELLDDVARQFLRSAREKGLDLGVECEPLEAFGDPPLLREALTNLVANAIAYTPAGAITLGAAGDTMGWSVSVEDTGPGLPASLAAGAGSRFARVPGASSGGSGLGLSIARAIATRHQGVLRLEPREGGTGLHAALWWPRSTAGASKES